MGSILLKTIEPLFPRGSGEIDPGVKGPYAHGSPMPLPYPTSILGVLSTILVNEGYSVGFNASSVEEWYRDFEELYSNVKGPYILVDNGYTKHVIVSSSPNGYARLETIYRNSLKLWEVLVEKGITEEYHSIKDKLVEYRIEKLIEERVSIALKDDKTVREHYLTTLRLIDYRSIAKHLPLAGYSVDKCSVFLGVDVEFKDRNITSIIKGDVPVRAFGRGRATILKLDKRNILETRLKNILDDAWSREIGEKQFILFLISPLIIEEINVGDIEGSSTHSTVYPHHAEIYAYLRKEISEICSMDSGDLDIVVDGVYSAIGLGYSLRFKRRKPPHAALLSGTIIYVKPREKCSSSPEKIYRRGFGFLRQLGFGTVVPIPTGS